MRRRQRPRQRDLRRMPVIGLVVIRVVCPRRLDMLLLITSRWQMLLVHRHLLLRSRPMLDASRPAAVSHVTIIHNCVLLHNRAVDIGLVNYGLIHAHHGGVICKLVSAPLAAYEADAHVAEPVVHAAVVAHIHAPVARMEQVRASLPAPVRRSPQRALIRRRNPRPRNPVVAVVAIRPVSGRPDQVWLRAQWLLIDRQHRWSEVYADEHPRPGLRNGDQRKQQRQQKPARGTKQSHGISS
jgi:hypothetical protein